MNFSDRDFEWMLGCVVLGPAFTLRFHHLKLGSMDCDP